MNANAKRHIESAASLTAGWRSQDLGDDEVNLIYADLQKVAACFVRNEGSGHMLQPTVLVHDTFLKLAEQTRLDWGNRDQLIGLARKFMKRCLIDSARRHGYVKHGAGLTRDSLDVEPAAAGKSPEVEGLHDCLDELDRVDPRVATVVRLRVFGGMSNQEIADRLAISLPTVGRRWKAAKVWLYAELAPRRKACVGDFARV